MPLGMHQGQGGVIQLGCRKFKKESRILKSSFCNIVDIMIFPCCAASEESADGRPDLLQQNSLQMMFDLRVTSFLVL